MIRPIAFSTMAAMSSACSAEVVQLVEVDRPDGRASAIVERTNAGATVSFSYSVYVREKGSKAEPQEVLRMDKGDVPKVVWLEDGSLSIAAPCGQIYYFTNFSTLRAAEIDFEKVPVKLQNAGLCAGS